MPLNVNQFLNVRSDETGLVLTLGFALFANALAQKVSEIASLSNFLIDVGPSQFLVVLVISSLITVAMTGLQSLWVDRFDRLTTVRGISAILALSFMVLRLMFLLKTPGWLNYGLFYLLSDQQLIFFPMAFWVLSSDVFDLAQSKRLFPLLASLGFAGSLAGIGITALSPGLFLHLQIKPEELLMLNILLYFGMYVGLEVGLKRIKLRPVQQSPETIREALTEGLQFVSQVPAFRYLMISIVAMIVSETIVEYRFYAVSGGAIADSGAYQTFLSLFTLGRTFAYLGIQTFITQRLITSLNLKDLFLIQPISSLLGASTMLAAPGLGGAIAGLSLQKLPQYSIDETARKAFAGLVPEERRGRVSLLLDSYVVSLGSIVGALITGIILFIGRWGGDRLPPHLLYLGVAGGMALLSLWAILQMRSVYDKSLLNWRLKRRQRGKSVLDKLEF
ncbi:MAG: hypothetical protein D6742_16600 [Cyanobacteria bacterium J069]|nr:MAG: hypothetical protein D6742_16600 [Cyanobacteria bacterium J069]